MTDDPARLLGEGSSDLVRSLISAGREEEPRAAALKSTLIAVGVGAAITSVVSAAAVAPGAGGASAASVGTGVVGTGAVGTASAALGTAKGAASSTLLVVVKWLALGAVTGTIVSSAAYRVSGALAPAPSVEVSAPRIPATAISPPTPPRRVTPTRELPEVPPPPVSVVPPAPPQINQESVAVAPKPTLAAEVAALDGARQALRAGDSARTLDLLSGYDARFPEGSMLPEALYLRLEALTLKGDKSNAEAVARRILRVYPSSPHAARARAVLGLDR